jgi:hypothetical protein
MNNNTINDYLAEAERKMEEASKNYDFSLADFGETRRNSAQEVLNMKEMCVRIMRREHNMDLVPVKAPVHYAFTEAMVNQLMMHAYQRGFARGVDDGYKIGFDEAYDTIREFIG